MGTIAFGTSKTEGGIGIEPAEAAAGLIEIGDRQAGSGQRLRQMDAGVSVERRGADHDHAAAPRSYQPRDRFTIATTERSEEHTSELQSLMRISYAVFCLKKKKNTHSDKHSKQYLLIENNK